MKSDACEPVAYRRRFILATVLVGSLFATDVVTLSACGGGSCEGGCTALGTGIYYEQCIANCRNPQTPAPPSSIPACHESKHLDLSQGWVLTPSATEEQCGNRPPGCACYGAQDDPYAWWICDGSIIFCLSKVKQYGGLPVIALEGEAAMHYRVQDLSHPEANLVQSVAK